MANSNAPRGLLPYSHFDGSVWNGSGNIYFIPAGLGTNLFIGDPVKTNSGTNDANGIPAIQLGTSGAPIVGVFMGLIPGGPNAGATIAVTRDLAIYHPTGVAQYCLVADDPTLLYWIQDDATSQATAPNLWSGKNANFVVGAGGSTITGYSSYQLGASTVATTNTLDLKIIRALNTPDNLIGTAANTNMNAKWLVKLNNYQYANQVAGV